jgi:predicted ribosome quality control (RQC) complex YloA/Tae2 family protein
MAERFSFQDKIKLLDAFIERERRFSVNGYHDDVFLLKEIANDYRARDQQKINGAVCKIARAIQNANRSRTTLGYQFGNLREIAELTIGFWPTIRQALEAFEKERGQHAEGDRTEREATPTVEGE